MVIERYRDGAAAAIYRRAREHGRMMPPGLDYEASWVDTGFERCFQLMRAEDASLFEAWTERWRDLVEFEVVPVRTSEEAAQIRLAEDA